MCCLLFFFFFFQAEDGIRDADVTGVQTCALPILYHANLFSRLSRMLVRIPVLICTAHNTYEAPTGQSVPREVSFREVAYRRSEERRVGKECRSRWARYQ